MMSSVSTPKRSLI